MTINTAPTLSADYNATLAKWAAAGYAADPACEWCERDLSGCEVIGTALGWFCVECAEAGHGSGGGDSDAAERANERRQMGITS